MEEERKVGFAAILLSNHYYLNEVSVEGKESSRLNSTLNTMITMQLKSSERETASLLTTIFIITEDSFWNTNYFEDLAKYVFWTFNKSFLVEVIEKIEFLPLPVLKRCQELLQENIVSTNTWFPPREPIGSFELMIQ